MMVCLNPESALLFDPGHPTQAQINAVADALDKSNDDPIARASGYIMTKMVMRALCDSTPLLHQAEAYSRNS